MLTANVVIIAALLYGALLFFLAYYYDKRSKRGSNTLISSPIVYTLSISVYCTSWTFYGAVGSAARNGLEFLAIYLGPTLVFIGWWYGLRKLVRIGRIHRITSIADLISSRYGKNNTLAVLVTLIAVVGTTPYIALQLKAVTTSLQVVGSTNHNSGYAFFNHQYELTTAFWIAVGMGIFTVLFGTRNLDANERHQGVVAAIACEAIVKLIALLAVGLFVMFGIGNGFGDILERLQQTSININADNVFTSRWMTLLILSASAIICLPRQFQITVVENSNEEHLRTASWLFPLYLLLMSLFTLPIAIVGLTTLPAGADPDMFVLTLPLTAKQDMLALLAFIGGFSSATSMVIIASIALSIMISNHIIMPVILNSRWMGQRQSGDVKHLLLLSRRVSIAFVIMLGFGYFWYSQTSAALASIGLISFCGVAQFLPAVIAGLYWRLATAKGVMIGLCLGVVFWAYCLLIPSFENSSFTITNWISNGPWGISILKPRALFGFDHFDPLVHAVFWSLLANCIGLIAGSLFSFQGAIERLQAALFVDVFRNPVGKESTAIHRSATIKDLYRLADRILGTQETQELFRKAAEDQGVEEYYPRPDTDFILYLERRLAGSIGAASAHAMISQVVTGERVSLDEIMRMANETQQAIEYSLELEHKSQELEQIAGKLQQANDQLKALDEQKDSFLSQVSHEVRTPMTSIVSFSEILLNNKDLEKQEEKRFLSIIHDESQRLTRLLDDILDLSVLERGAPEWILEPINAEINIDRAIASCTSLAAKKNMEIISDLRADNAFIVANADRFCQVFINLISNSIKYNTSARPRVIIKSWIEGDRYWIDVDDNGPGVDPEDVDYIFSKFSRGSAQSLRQQSGSGLGLAISKQIIARFKGRLYLVPKLESGACFRVELALLPRENRVSKVLKTAKGKSRKEETIPS